MILQEILRMVDFDNVVPLFEKNNEKYMGFNWLFYAGIEQLHRYREALDRMCLIKPMFYKDFNTATLYRRSDGTLGMQHPDLGDDVDVACNVYFERDGEKILWTPEYSSYITAEEIACTAVMNVPTGNVDVIWLCSNLSLSRPEFLKGLHNDNPYAMAYFRISERLRKTILPKRFWEQEQVNRESAKYWRAEVEGNIKRNRAKRKRHYRWGNRLKTLLEMAKRWELYLNMCKLVVDYAARAELWHCIKNAENLGHEGFYSYATKNAAQYIQKSINRYYRGKAIEHDLSFVVITSTSEGIAANKDIEDVLRQSGLCHNPQFFYTTDNLFSGRVKPEDFTVEILYIKNQNVPSQLVLPSRCGIHRKFILSNH